MRTFYMESKRVQGSASRNRFFVSDGIATRGIAGVFHEAKRRHVYMASAFTLAAY
jgi:hypothetical protein